MQVSHEMMYSNCQY